MNDDLEYLRNHLRAASLIPHPWDQEDRNLAVFRSKEELVEWYGQPPGVVNQPYRDRAFYTRELAMLSRLVKPRSIVEFGTSIGIGTCLLHWLNPTARLVTVDVNTETFLPGDQRVPMGYMAKHQRIPCEYHMMNSWEYSQQEVDLCFIDADHSYGSVVRDSYRAWANRSRDHCWAIAWHDHNDRHPGIVQAVSEFCHEVGKLLQLRRDSDTVWVTGGST